MRARKSALAVAATGLACLLLISSAVQAATVAPTRPVIVMLADSVARPGAVANDLTARFGGNVGHVYRTLIKGFSANLPDAAIVALQADPRVLSIDPDTIATTTEDSLPTGVNRIELDQRFTGLTTSNSVNYGSSVQVAVVDTGIDDRHPDLNVVDGVNCASNAGCSAGLPGDGNGHGSHVAGTIAAKDDGSGVVGVAPGAALYAVEVLDRQGSGYFSWIIAGLDYVASKQGTWGIDVVNMSLGGSGSCSQYDALRTAIGNLVNSGTAVVVAAGNNGANASNYIPASCTAAITVSAVSDSDGQPGGTGGSPSCRSEGDDVLAAFSNFGSVVDIAAPGVCILSTWKSGGYSTISGTSMASPHVAGAVALGIALGQWTASNIPTVSATSACGYNDRGRAAGPMLYLVSCSGSGGGGGGTTTQPGAFNKLSPSNNATGVGRTVTFQWQASTDATGYTVSIYNSSGAFLQSFPASGTSLTVSRFSRSTTYQWQVVANNGAGSTTAGGGNWTFRT
ncbi:MAG: S8 family serine peptidase [Actinomycetota bacterium]